MSDIDSDVIIVGGGPAGAWAARLLAAAGARVRVLDASHPREKPCGGGLTARSLDLIGDAIAGVPVRPVSRVRFEAAPVGRDPYPPPPRRAPSVTVDLEPARHGRHAPLVIVDRTSFDGALIDAARRAGADLVADRAVHVEASRDAVLVRTRRHTFRARWLIGADGAASLVRHRLARRLPRSSLSIALGFYVRDWHSREIVVRFVSHPPGYIWSFPRTDHLAVGICAQADQADATTLRRQLAAWLAAEGLANGRRVEPYSWPIPSPDASACAAGVPAGDRWLLVGDAAGLVDPLTREGIYYALLSGARAAEALLADGGSPSVRYTGSLRGDVLPELARAHRARRSFFWPTVSRLWVDALTESPRVRLLGLQVVLGEAGYHHLRRAAVRRLEPGAALRVLGRQVARRLRPQR